VWPGSAPPDPDPDVPRTDWGGLLFLLGVVGELGLPAELAGRPGGRSLRWWLHQLALLLVPAEESDPAALAFAGLAPDVEPPSAHEPRPSRTERAAVAALASRCADDLALRLADERPGLVVRVCGRRAQIAADPGWLEVRLAAEDADTAVRRAGLDLDPGHIPWLGVVVRFAYV
jgi:hypothetical protein